VDLIAVDGAMHTSQGADQNRVDFPPAPSDTTMVGPCVTRALSVC
jgi:hypothetical protein